MEWNVNDEYYLYTHSNQSLVHKVFFSFDNLSTCATYISSLSNCLRPSSLLLLYVNWVWSNIGRNRQPSCFCARSAKKPKTYLMTYSEKMNLTASHNILERGIMCVCARSILNNTYWLLKALTREAAIRFDTQQCQHLWTDHESAGNFVWSKGKW